MRLQPARGRRLVTLVAIVAAAVFASGRAPAAEPTPFARLLPEDTLIYLHFPSAAALRNDFWNTSIGRMLDDPQLRPLVDQSFAALERAFEPVREQFGLSLMEWLRLPQGELGIAVVPIADSDPAVLLLLAADEQDRAIETVLERGRAAAQKAGMIEESETVGDVRLNIWRTSAGRSRQILYLRRDGRLLVTSHRDAAKHALKLWSGDGEATLSVRPAFATLERLVGTAEGHAAQALFYIDPIQLVRTSTRGNTAAQVGLAVLPAIGLDGLSALGGSMTFQHPQFEQITQAYLLLDVPRAGVLELIALRPTTLEPPPWAFDDLVNYASFAWDFERTYHELRKLVDSFQGEGSLRRSLQLDVVRDRGLDIEQDLLAKLSGQACWMTALDRPLTARSRGHLFGVQFGKAQHAEEAAKKIADISERKPKLRSVAGRKLYEFSPPDEVVAVEGEIPHPVLGAIGDYLVFSDRSTLFERALEAADDESKRLTKSLDFKLIASKARRYAGDDGPGYLGFVRPEEEIRYLHGLLQDERVRERLRRGGERNNVLKDFDQALTDRPLPPIETLQRYYAPAGSIVVDEPTGVRFLSFTLRRTE